MYSIKNLEDLQQSDIPNPTDINDVIIDKDLPIKERLESYLEQIQNPYCYQCDDVYIKTSYIDNEIFLDEIIQKYFFNNK